MCYDRHSKNNNPTGNKFFKVRKKSVRLKNRVDLPGIKIQSKVGMNVHASRPSRTSKCYQKCCYPGCCNNNSNNKFIQFHKLRIEPTYPKSKVPRFEQVKNFRINKKKRHDTLDRLGKPNRKHSQWCSDHELDTPFKSHATFPCKNKSCTESFNFFTFPNLCGTKTNYQQ